VEIVILNSVVASVLEEMIDVQRASQLESTVRVGGHKEHAEHRSSGGCVLVVEGWLRMMAW